MRIAAVADLHVTRTSHGELRPLLEAAKAQAQVLLLCGDLTDYGLPEEAQLLAGELAALEGLPAIAVLGNHDYESGHADEVKRVLTDHGVLVLDGDACEVDGVGFAGAKGFAGGFGRGSLSPWGEPMIKAFVQEAVGEAIKLESALGRLRTDRRVVLLHYAPIAATVEGEPREIFPYLGSARLEEPLGRLPVDVVFHGHAHRGSLAGTTASGVPVYNVSLPLLRRAFPDGPAFRLFELPPREAPPEAGNGSRSRAYEAPPSAPRPPVASAQGGVAAGGRLSS